MTALRGRVWGHIVSGFWPLGWGNRVGKANGGAAFLCQTCFNHWPAVERCGKPRSADRRHGYHCNVARAHRGPWERHCGTLYPLCICNPSGCAGGLNTCSKALTNGPCKRANHAEPRKGLDCYALHVRHALRGRVWGHVCDESWCSEGETAIFWSVFPAQIARNEDHQWEKNWLDKT